ncbi:rubredoxin [Candidatus Gracilibacteria bacterium]|nr:rubredoxin [Candidatus Gracilibacteria bacterium]
MKVLGKYRKIIQQLAYLALLAGVIHASLVEGEIGSAIALIIIYIILKVFEWGNIGFKKTGIKAENLTSTKDGENFKQWKCNPCAYVYNEQLGDPEGGIAPGTKRENIPNNWKCPICGVGKDQFTMIVRENKKIEYIKGKVINRKMLTKNILELSVELKENLEIKPGQWMGFVFEDKKGNFVRAYSIANHEKQNDFTDCIFVIKLLEDGRGSNKLKEMKIGDEIKVNGVFGHFVLNDNDNEKVFIATGSGLAPIINMIRNCNNKIKKTLILGAQYKNDIFYEEDIKKISNLNYKIFLSREDVEGYESGRINLDQFELNDNMEFYICGAPPVVKSILEILRNKGFTKIYYEQYF